MYYILLDITSIHKVISHKLPFKMTLNILLNKFQKKKQISSKFLLKIIFYIIQN